ncbi:4-hydroxy-tetrahydrodipicolinate synthase [Algiphilus sp.]|uniref:4-hydroxy-tetrahydrodipicolinate synthase n=1 Tax=Algiphilus sp. TaxID=1872431 RepID=UPI003B52ADC9
MITGSIVALATPMDSNGEVQFDALAALVQWHIASGTAAIVSMGTTGESATLNTEEHIAVIRKTVEAADGRIPVIAGTGANATSEAIELTQSAADAGADAALLVTPYYNKPPQEGLYRHFRAVAEAVDIPQILYNVPGRTGCDMQPATVQRLAELPNVIGLKEALADHDRIRALVELGLPGDFALYSGDDPTACDAILAGFHGDISVVANVVPEIMARMCNAAVAGDEAKARAADAEMAELHQLLFVEPNPIPVKWALHAMGRIGGGIRLPLVPLSETHHDRVRAALRTVGAVQ